MKKFVIEEEFWALFPTASIGVIICEGIDNTVKNESIYEELLNQAEIEAQKFFQNDEFSSNSAIAIWREAYQMFKTKKGARSSIEALLKRVKNGSHIGTINPLVDIYNSISLRYGLPCGGEDIDNFVGDMRLTKAIGNEQFVPLGTEENVPPYEGEIIYKDDAGAICRCWNWREAKRTMLTENTKNAFLCIELVDETRIDDFNMALKELGELVVGKLGCTARIQILDINNREAIITV
jgi:DNA/RNA-binding domain of Phe-tRNA-synthetase-like protein